MNYLDKLRAASAARESLLCVGLDPEPKTVPGGLEGAIDRCRRIIDATVSAIIYADDHRRQAMMWRDRIRQATEHAHQR